MAAEMTANPMMYASDLSVRVGEYTYTIKSDDLAHLPVDKHELLVAFAKSSIRGLLDGEREPPMTISIEKDAFSSGESRERSGSHSSALSGHSDDLFDASSPKSYILHLQK